MAVTAIVLVTLPMVGVESWVDYLSGLRQATMVCGDPTFFNPSFACLVAPLVGATVAKWLGLGLAAVLVLLAVRSGPTVTGCTLVAAAIMAPAIELHSHYLAMLYVLVVIALASVSVRARSAAAAPTPEPA